MYTRSAHAFSRAQAQAQMEIAELRVAVEEINVMVRDKDAIIRDLKLDLAQKRGLIQQLERIAQGVRRDDEVMESEAERADRMIKRRANRADEIVEDKARGADTMMELIKEMRESRREAYDPL